MSNMPTMQGCQAPWKRAAVLGHLGWAGQRSASFPSFRAPVHTTDVPFPVSHFQCPICPLPGISLLLAARSCPD